MQIELLDKIDHEEYKNFINDNPQSTFYQSSKHLNFLQNLLDCKPNFLTIKDNNQLKAVMPFFIKSSIYGKVINSLPFFGSYGGLISDNLEYGKKILENFNEYVHDEDILSSTIISNPFFDNSIYEKYFNFDVKDERLIQCIKFNNKTENEVWNLFEQRVRRAIRKCQKNNIVVLKNQIDENTFINFHKQHKSEMDSKNGRSKPFSFFDKLTKNFRIELDYDVFTASYNDKIIAHLLVFHHYPFTEYYMPAYDSNFKNLQAPSSLIWESIKNSISRNMTYYNFGGTWKDQPELYRFKRGWNTVDMNYFYFIKANIETIKDIDRNELIEKYKNFYVFPFDKL